MYLNRVLSFCSFLIIASALRYEGDRCQLSGAAGVCISLQRCPSAIELLRQNQRPQHCGFDGSTPIVCCPIEGRATNKQSCLRYPPRNAIPELPKPTTRTVTVGNMTYNIYAVVGGYTTALNEFPHMVALGYGESNNIQYQCGAAIIDEQFALTAAHCLYSPAYGTVRWVRAGDGNIKTDVDDQNVQLVEVGQIFKHPNYRPPVQYHDIALIRFRTPLVINDYVRPACLHVDYQLPNAELIAIGWGRIQYTVDGDGSLLKVNVTKFPYETCSEVYNNLPRRLPQGIRDEGMICAGGVDEAKDTCQGDSGGPLQVTNSLQRTEIVGVTSFGKACGVNNIPGVYSRVSYYYPWIESIVWPNN